MAVTSRERQWQWLELERTASPVSEMSAPTKLRRMRTPSRLEAAPSDQAQLARRNSITEIRGARNVRGVTGERDSTLNQNPLVLAAACPTHQVTEPCGAVTSQAGWQEGFDGAGACGVLWRMRACCLTAVGNAGVSVHEWRCR